MLFPATTLLVKMCLERSAERDKHENKNKISAEDGQSECGGHFKWGNLKRGGTARRCERKQDET